MAETSWMTALVGGLAGAGIAAIINIWNMRHQVRLEDKKRQWAIDDERKKKEHEVYERRMKAYNRIMKADGELRLVRFYDFLRPPDRFEYDLYAGTMRDVIFEDFHLLDPEIRDLANHLDRHLNTYRFDLELGVPPSETNHEFVIQHYYEFIQKVRGKYTAEASLSFYPTDPL